MFFTRLKFLTRVFISKAFLPYLYNKYVKNNEVIIEDINQNFHIRSQKRNLSLKKKFLHLLVYYPEFAFVFFWRIQSNFFLWEILFKYNQLCKIFTSSLIKGGLVVYHPYATVINAKKIGKNFTFRNGLTIGNKNNDNTLLPTIGNNVEVGANVVIIGDIEIGDNVTIGAGSVVVKSVPSNCVIAGKAGIVGHIKIADNTTVGANTGVSKNITKSGQTLFGYVGYDIKDFLKSYSLFKKLPELNDRIKELEKKP